MFSFFFFFSSRRRHTRLQGDWSSDVCSSDLAAGPTAQCGKRHLDVKGWEGWQLACAWIGVTVPPWPSSSPGFWWLAGHCRSVVPGECGQHLNYVVEVSGRIMHDPLERVDTADPAVQLCGT